MGAGGATLIFSYMRRLGSFFFWGGGGGFKVLNFNILGGFQKNEYVLGFENFVDIFWGSSQNWTKFRGHFYAFYGLFLWPRYRMGDIFGGLLKFQIFFGCLKFLIFSLVNGRCWARAYV